MSTNKANRFRVGNTDIDLTVPDGEIGTSKLADKAVTKAKLAGEVTQDIEGRIPMPQGGTTGQVLKKTADGVVWGNESSTTTHNNLDGRDTSNAHPMSAITGLPEALGGKYVKPQGGIPSSDLALAIQQLLDKAGTSVQPADVADFITKNVNDLANYYLKSETYTQEEVDGFIAAVAQALTAYRTASNQDVIDNGIKDRLDDIEDVIPSQASAQNQVADKNFVNSSIQTASANFRGNWATKSAIPTDYTLYPADYAGNRKPTTNDYLVVQADESQDGGTWRYKYSGDWDTDGINGWFAEYEVNETPLTAAQLAALNSGITQQAVQQIADNTTALANRYTKNETDSAIEAHHDPTKQNFLTFDSVPTSGSTNPVTSNGVYDAATTPIVSSPDTAVTVAMDCAKKYKYMNANGVSTLAFTLNAPTDATKAQIWYIKFRSGATATDITWPMGLYYPDGTIPDIEADAIYEIMIDEDYCLTIQKYAQSNS